MGKSTRKAIPVMKLRETHPENLLRESESMTVFRIWSLLGGDEEMRDQTVGNRKL